MAPHGYKKYMKKDIKGQNSLAKIFVLAFFGTLLIVTFLIKIFSPTADTSIGDYKDPRDFDDVEETKKIVDNRLEMIKEEDQGRSFTELMNQAANNSVVEEERKVNDTVVENKDNNNSKTETVTSAPVPPKPQEAIKPAEQEAIYRVYVGSYTSAELAKVAKDIIQESGNGLNPIVKCIGSNNYTLQVGIFKNKKSAESLLYTLQQSHLPGRIVQEY